MDEGVDPPQIHIHINDVVFRVLFMLAAVAQAQASSPNMRRRQGMVFLNISNQVAICPIAVKYWRTEHSLKP